MNFLNIHILHTIPFSNLNRDDAGSPKSMVYGGVSRARLSSQALKRAARVSFEAGSTADRTSRSKYTPRVVADRAVELLIEQGHAVDDSVRLKLETAAKKLVTSLVQKNKAADSAGDAPVKKDTLTWLAEAEINEAAVKAAATVTGVDLGDKFVQSATNSVTIAAFGRMFAARPDLQTEAGIQVAHAFTCHAASPELDYFTAVDDLRSMFETDDGAGHLDIGQFTSGVFYRYLNIDRRQLRKNWSGVSGADADARLRALARALVLTLPNGKANVTAPHTLPSFLLVQEAEQGLSFADAFETPVKAADYGGFAVPAHARLSEHARMVSTAAGSLVGERRTWALTGGGELESLDDVSAAVAEWIRQDAS